MGHLLLPVMAACHISQAFGEGFDEGNMETRDMANDARMCSTPSGVPTKEGLRAAVSADNEMVALLGDYFEQDAELRRHMTMPADVSPCPCMRCQLGWLVVVMKGTAALQAAGKSRCHLTAFILLPIAMMRVSV